MKAIWKFECPVDDVFTLEMPPKAQLLHFGTQGDRPMLWAMVDTDPQPAEQRTFRLAGTGHNLNIPDNQNAEYIGTCGLMAGALIFHLFEITPDGSIETVPFNRNSQ